MLTRIAISNFRSIGVKPGGAPGIDRSLKPLTVLVGPNGAGKSSILEAIALASQQGRLRGDLVAYMAPIELVHKYSLN